MSFNAIKAMLGLSSKLNEACNAPICTVCPASPGTVTPHVFHVLVRLHAPLDNADAEGKTADFWWPEKVDSDEAIIAVNAAIKEAENKIPGNVKVTAFDYPATPSPRPQPQGTHDVLIFPAGVHLVGVPLAALGQVVIAILENSAAEDISQIFSSIPGGPHEVLKGPTALVCCHRSRDARCGRWGPPLAAALGGLGARAILSSHVGGHQYAGNVILYHKGHPIDKNWFGGLTEAEAVDFWKAVSELSSTDEPVGNESLRKYWRGKSGMQKVEQLEMFERCGKVADIEDMGKDRGAES